MHKYESIILVDDNLTQKQKENTIEMVKKFINENGEISKIEILGSKKLAYEVRKQKTAYYCVFNFIAEPTVILELERKYRLTDEIIKYITIRIDE